MAVHFVGAKTNPKLRIGDYTYIRDRTVIDTEKIHWKCEKSKSLKCRARVITQGETIVKTVRTHSHASKHQDEFTSISEVCRITPLENIITDVCANIDESFSKKLSASASQFDASTIINLEQESTKFPLQTHNASITQNCVSEKENSVESEEINIASLIKMLANSLSTKTAEGGVYLSTKEVKAIELFLEDHKDVIEETVKQEVIEEPEINGICEELQETTEKESQMSSKRPPPEFRPDYAEVAGCLGVAVKSRRKRSRLSELSQDNPQRLTNGIEIQAPKANSQLEGETSETANLFRILNEIIETKRVHDELFYIPSKTVISIQSFLVKYNKY